MLMIVTDCCLVASSSEEAIWKKGLRKALLFLICFRFPAKRGFNPFVLPLMKGCVKVCEGTLLLLMLSLI